MESRELLYFVAVAEERNFSRAADRLGIAQPPLSRAIQRLERRLGVRLLERTPRQVSLTPAGEVLLNEGRKVLTNLDAAEQLTRRAGREPRLVVTMKPGGDAGLLESILARFAEQPDTVDVEVLICAIGEQENLLRDGTADVALLRTPQHDLSGLATEELLTEREVVVLPRGHRLAGRASVRTVDLTGEVFPRWTQDSPDRGPVITDTGQVAELIALGQITAVLPESVACRLGRDLVTIPVDDRRTTLLAAWPEERRDRALAAFVRTATEVASASSTANAPLPERLT